MCVWGGIMRELCPPEPLQQFAGGQLGEVFFVVFSERRSWGAGTHQLRKIVREEPSIAR